MLSPKYNPEKELLGNRNAARNSPAVLCHNTESQPLYPVWFERSPLMCCPDKYAGRIFGLHSPANFPFRTVVQESRNPGTRGQTVRKINQNFSGRGF